MDTAGFYGTQMKAAGVIICIRKAGQPGDSKVTNRLLLSTPGVDLIHLWPQAHDVTRLYLVLLQWTL